MFLFIFLRYHFYFTNETILDTYLDNNFTMMGRKDKWKGQADNGGYIDAMLPPPVRSQEMSYR